MCFSQKGPSLPPLHYNNVLVMSILKKKLRNFFSAKVAVKKNAGVRTCGACHSQNNTSCLNLIQHPDLKHYDELASACSRALYPQKMYFCLYVTFKKSKISMAECVTWSFVCNRFLLFKILNTEIV